MQDDPRALLVWQPLARAVRQLYPLESAAIDRASGGAFPFGREMMTAAHARWTSDWLSWERTHDADYKLKAAVLQEELAAGGDAAVGRARAEALEREKLALYQRRYAEYTRVAKALQTLATTATAALPAAPSRGDGRGIAEVAEEHPPPNARLSHAPACSVTRHRRQR